MEIGSIISKIPTTINLYLFEDFNARVGADHDYWLPYLDYCGIERINKYGQGLLEFCYNYDLCTTRECIKKAIGPSLKKMAINHD